MYEAEINARLNELTAAAEARHQSSDPAFTGAMGGASIAYMTNQERTERHRLITLLPSTSERIDEAKRRLKARINARHIGTRSQPII